MGDVMVPRTQAQADLAARDEWWRGEYAKVKHALADAQRDANECHAMHRAETARADRAEQRAVALEGALGRIKDECLLGVSYKLGTRIYDIVCEALTRPAPRPEDHMSSDKEFEHLSTKELKDDLRAIILANPTEEDRAFYNRIVAEIARREAKPKREFRFHDGDDGDPA